MKFASIVAMALLGCASATKLESENPHFFIRTTKRGADDREDQTEEQGQQGSDGLVHGVDGTVVDPASHAQINHKHSKHGRHHGKHHHHSLTQIQGDDDYGIDEALASSNNQKQLEGIMQMQDQGYAMWLDSEISKTSIKKL